MNINEIKDLFFEIKKTSKSIKVDNILKSNRLIDLKLILDNINIDNYSEYEDYFEQISNTFYFLEKEIKLYETIFINLELIKEKRKKL